MSIEPTCQFCNEVTKYRCPTIEVADNCHSFIERQKVLNENMVVHKAPQILDLDYYVIMGWNSKYDKVYFNVDQSSGYPSFSLSPRYMFSSIKEASSKLEDAAEYAGIIDPKIYKIQLVEEDVSSLQHYELDSFIEGLTEEQLNYLRGKL